MSGRPGAWSVARLFEPRGRRRLQVAVAVVVALALVVKFVDRQHWVGDVVVLVALGVVALIAVRLAVAAGASAERVAQEQQLLGSTLRRGLTPPGPAPVDASAVTAVVDAVDELAGRVAAIERSMVVPGADLSRVEARCVVLQDRLEVLADELRAARAHAAGDR